MDDRNKPIDYELADIVTDCPHEFTIGRKHYRLYPVTLAKLYRLRPYIDALGIDEKVLSINPYIEALRVVSENREICSSIIAIHTAPNTYKDLFNRKKTAERRNEFSRLSDDDLASLLIVALTADKAQLVMERYGVDKEQERLQRVMKVKEVGKNNLTFGGNTIFGSFIAPLKELGYTDNEILYERGYGYLRMMLADKISSVYLSDEELNGVSKADGGTLIDANDPDEADRLKALFANRGITIK